MACEKLFIQHLRQRGLRLTPQREMLLSVLHEIRGTATAEEIYARVQRYSTSVDVSTVYRTLDLLREMGLVSAIELGDGHMRFELLGLSAPHLHLVCRQCGRIEGVPIEQARALIDHLWQAYGFDANLDEVTIPGLCEECRTLAQSA